MREDADLVALIVRMDASRGMAEGIVQPHMNCAGCGACKMFAGEDGGKKPVRLRCPEPVPVGSKVYARSSESGELVSSLLLFGAPVAGFLAASLAVHFAGGSEGWIALAGFAGLFLVFFILRVLEARGFFLSLLPEVIGIVEDEPASGERRAAGAENSDDLPLS